jgi:hypothetical protein
MMFWIRHYTILAIQALGMTIGVAVLFLWLALSIPMLITAGLLMNKSMVKVLTDMNFEKIKPIFK